MNGFSLTFFLSSNLSFFSRTVLLCAPRPSLSRVCFGLRAFSRLSSPCLCSVRLLQGHRERPIAEMPKKDKTPLQGASRETVPCPVVSGPVAVDKNGVVTVAVHAKPGSKLNAITDVTAEAVGIAIAAPPSEGEANAELCRYLSKILGVKKSEVVLDKGGKSREKVVKILASSKPEDILNKLRAEAASST